ncbi:hypothetical protein RND81_01G145600 [Saponaria officinalis]|uniref:Chromatin modification-related protein EAF1 B-like n=1 Tax=Saponaria officinalis TaxID=3572 RepID=A0AAW1NER3_SAPOF
MHGLSSGFTFLVNAESDSMGGVVDGGVGIGTKPSPCCAEIEKAQAQLRLEYDVREERRKELEFLEKGGDPLDFKFAHAALVSIQCTSHTDRDPYQNLTSEANGSFPLTASPRGDSVESSGRLGLTTVCEPNSADNFDGEDEILQSDRKSTRPERSSIIPSEDSSQLDRTQNIKYLEDSPVSQSKEGQLYRRRNRSRPNRDDPRSDSADMASHGEHGSCMPSHYGLLSKPVASENQVETKSDGTHVIQSTSSRVSKLVEEKLNLSTSKEKLQEVHNLSLKPDESPTASRTVEPAIVVGRANVDTLDVDRPSSSGAEKIEYHASSTKLNGTAKVNGDDNCTATDALINNVPVTTMDVDSESSCSRTNVIVDGNGNIDSDLCANLMNVDSNGSAKEPKLNVVKNLVSEDNKMASDDNVTNAMETVSCIKEDQSFIDHQGNWSAGEDKAEVDGSKSSLQSETKGVSYVERQERHDNNEMNTDKELDQRENFVPEMDSSCSVRPPPVDPAFGELNRNGFSGQPSVLETQSGTENQSKPLDKAQEDRILEEARTIVAKRKRIAALSTGLLLREHRRKGHWDLVLEEMAWLANDFAQERIWKMTAAAQICRRVAFASRLRLEKQNTLSKPKSVAHTLANAVMEFWQVARLSTENADISQHEKCKHEASLVVNDKDEASRDVLQSTRRKPCHAVYGYAVRFLQFNCSSKPLVAVEVPEVTDVACDIVLPELSWQDKFTEENLFYAVPPGAMELYRKSIESCLAECERIGDNIQEEVVTSARDATADNNYEEDEGEHVYYQPAALDSGKPPKKKRKNMKLYAARSYEFGGDIGYGHCAETGNGTTQLNVMGKRPASSLHVDPIPIKRMRTASRQRVIGPLGAGPVGVAPVLSRADASSEDTNSFQDDQNTLHGGSVVPRGLEVDSTMNFEKQSTYDSAEMSTKPKKKKKIKHQSLYDQRWQLDSSIQNEQKEHVRKRLDNHQLESNGDSSLFGQHAKKPKLGKHSLENSFDNAAPMCGSVASPVASQMSNMSSQTKLIKLIGGRDKGKKGKGLKVSTGQLGSGSPWTIVEDQALVVLVHDMGPNWELVSDAINSILQFKCIFRKPQECKERHKFLMDRPSGDGADSGEDSGSSQPYPSTLPGIPKGSARQLFRSLHAHVEEDNIKSRFEKIIRIEQQLYLQKKKNDHQDMRQIASAHSSHVLSLSQVIPNNVNGGVLTPLDLCDTDTCNQDTLSHAGGSALPNQSSIPLMTPPSGVNPQLQSLQGSSSMAIGTILASPPSQFSSARDARYSVPRSGSLPIEEQQRLHQYNSMLQGRNVQASNPSLSGSLSGSDRGVRMQPGINGASMMPGMNRSISMARPGAQAIPSPTAVLASNMGGMPSNMNVNSGTASDRGNGNTIIRPREPLHGVRSGQNSEHQRQMVLPGMQQATQTNSQGIPAFGGLGSGFSNHQAAPYHHPHVLNSPHSHMSTLEKQAYIRMRQMQQRSLHLQHQTPSQLPISSPSSSQPVPVPSPTPSSPMTHVGPVPHPQQNNVQGRGRSAQSAHGGMINQGGKQRQGQAQQFQQSGRQHPQQRQQSQSHPTPKLMKVIGRGNMAVHQNGLNSPNSASQVAEEGDQALHLMQGQNSYSGSTLNTQPSSNPLVSPAISSLAQTPYVNTSAVTSKPVQQISSHLDNRNQGRALGSNQGPNSTVVLSRNRQQLQGQPSLKMVNQSQPNSQKISQQNRPVNSESLIKSQVDSSLIDHKALSAGQPQPCVNSSSNVLKKVQESVSDSSLTNDSSLLGPSKSQAVTNSSGIDPLPSVSQCLVVEQQSLVNNLVSRELEAQWEQQEAHLQPPPLQPILPQKQ